MACTRFPRGDRVGQSVEPIRRNRRSECLNGCNLSNMLATEVPRPDLHSPMHLATSDVDEMRSNNFLCGTRRDDNLESKLHQIFNPLLVLELNC